MAPRSVLLVLALACSAALPASAHAAIEETTSGTGELVISWRGDPARGCAAQGVCDIAGAIVLTPREDGGSLISSDGGDDGPNVSLRLDSSGPRVVRGPAEAPLGVCSDVGTGVSVSVFGGSGPGADDALPALLADDDGLSAGRCAGPAARDLRVELLAPTRIPAATLRRSRFAFGLPGRRTFGAGPYTIDAVSTLTVRGERRRVQDEEFDDVREGPPPSEPEPRRAVLSMTFAATAPAATLTSRLFAAPAPACELFDACGLTGTQVLRIDRARTVVRLTATGPASLARGRHRVRRMLAALRAGRLQLESVTGARGATGATLESAVTRGSTTCHDRLPASVQPISVVGDRLALGHPNQSWGPDDRLRTRCPGPYGAPGTGMFLSAPLDLQALAAGRVAARLRPADVVDPWPYAVSTDGAVPVTLRRIGPPRVGVVRR